MSWRPIDSVPRDGTAVLLCWAIDADGNRTYSQWTDEFCDSKNELW